MFNTIKKINMENIYSGICKELNADKEKARKIEDMCIKIEEDPEFNSLFFFH